MKKEINLSTLSATFEELEALKLSMIPSSQAFAIRLDGIQFSKYTEGLIKPFDDKFQLAMKNATVDTLADLDGACFAHQQSDELSILFYPRMVGGKYVQHLFAGRVDKMLTKTASLMTFHFNKHAEKLGIGKGKMGLFDARLFILPQDLVEKYFIWRQELGTINSINALAVKVLGHEEATGTAIKKMQEKIFDAKGIKRTELEIWKKRGIVFYKKELEDSRYYTDKEGNQQERKNGKYVWELNEYMPILKKEWLGGSQTWVLDKIRAYVSKR